MENKTKRLSISFKQTSKDMMLWAAISNLEEKSLTIKDILYKVLIENKEIK